MEHEGDVDTNCNLEQSLKGLIKGVEDLEITGQIVTIQAILTTIGQNTEKSPGDLSRLAITQTPVRSHQLTLV